MKETSHWMVALAGVALLGCGGGDADVVRGEYEIVGPAFCEIDEPGEPLDVFSVTGTVDVIGLEGREGRPDDCQHLVWMRTDICETCATASTQLCLRAPSGGGWTLGPGYTDEIGIDSLDLVGRRGGVSFDLFVHAQQVTGTFGPDGDAPVLEIDGTGTVKTGISGSERDMSIHCEIHTTRAR